MTKIIGENAFEQKKKKPALKFSPGLALIDPGNWALSTISRQALNCVGSRNNKQ